MDQRKVGADKGPPCPVSMPQSQSHTTLHVPERRFRQQRQPSTTLRLKITAGWLLILLCLFFSRSAFSAVAPDPSEKNYFLVEKQYRQANSYYQNLRTGNRGKDRANWLNSVNTFRKLYQENKDTAVAPKCLFMLGKCFLDMYERFNNPMDLEESLAYFEDVTTRFPSNRLADDALFAFGSLHLVHKNDPKKAARSFAKIVALYADGDMASGAAQHLEKLRDTSLQTSEPAAPVAPPPAAAPVAPPSAAAAPTVEEPKKPEPESVPLRNASLLPIKYWSNNNYTRVVVETSEPVIFKHQMLEKSGDLPRRLYIDLVGCRLGQGGQSTVPIQDGLLRQVRNAQYSPDTVRVVLDTQTDISDYKVFNLEDPFRVVIDVMSSEAPPQTAQKTPADAKLSLARQLGLGVKRIILDPGHGGKDPGTMTSDGLMEKDIVLRVAKKVAQKLRAKLDCEIILTRETDIFIPLEERTAIANSREGDLFISIHVNAAPNEKVKGIETYVLDLATNPDAMRVAAQENSTSARKVSDLQAILLDLIQNTKINESVKLAEIVQDNMVTGLGRQYENINNLGVKKAPFIVLIGARMPAILTEIAFLSNPMEETRLKNDAYLNSLSEHISAGVSGYVNSMNMAGYLPAQPMGGKD